MTLGLLSDSSLADWYCFVLYLSLNISSLHILIVVANQDQSSEGFSVIVLIMGELKFLVLFCDTVSGKLQGIPETYSVTCFGRM